MASINPHYVPGMGFKKHQPMPKPPGALDKVVTRVSCGEVELKLTLTPKLLARPLRDAVVEPFLKAHNKRANAIAWVDLACIVVDGKPLDAMDDVQADAVLKQESCRLQLVPLSGLPRSLLDGFLAVARVPPLPYSQDPPALTKELVRIAEAAAAAEEPDADVARRCTNAFHRIGHGEALISVAAARSALLYDDEVRSIGFPELSPHGAAIDGALHRMVTNRDAATVDLSQFSRFFSAVSAAACAPPEAGVEEVAMDSYGPNRTGNSFLDDLLGDDSVTARQVA